MVDHVLCRIDKKLKKEIERTKDIVERTEGKEISLREASGLLAKESKGVNDLLESKLEPKKKGEYDFLNLLED